MESRSIITICVCVLVVWATFLVIFMGFTLNQHVTVNSNLNFVFVPQQKQYVVMRQKPAPPNNNESTPLWWIVSSLGWYDDDSE